jgi:hypothetical protein
MAVLDDVFTESQRRRESSWAAVPVILWLLLLITGALLLISRTPLGGPSFNALTAFDCDARPMFESGWMRGQHSQFLYVCKSGNEALLQQTSIPVAGRFGAWRACSRAKGVVTIWRYHNPSPYGSYVFQSACGGEVYATYAAQSAKYRAVQTSGVIIAWSLIVLSGGGLAVCSYRWLRRKLSKEVPAV